MNVEFFFFICALIMLGVTVILSVGYFIFSKFLLKFKEKDRFSTYLERQVFTIKTIIFITTILSLFFITISIISRSIVAGHGPFSNMYEFTTAFAWGVLVMTVFFWWKYRSVAINAAGVLIALILLLIANTMPSKVVPLVPALQNSILLSAHVASAIIAYGTFTISFISAVFYIIQNNKRFSWLPDSESLEKISYHSVIIGFPFMTLVIILGALWADIAWGRYWSWDPKETASLVTWLIYAGYLHARIIRHWRGKKTALLLIIGFAAVIFTFFGNYIFNGLHSYG